MRSQTYPSDVTDEQWRSFTQVDVLQLIGATFLIVQALVFIAKSRRAFTISVFVLAIPGLANPMHSVEWTTHLDPQVFIAWTAVIVLAAIAIALASRSTRRRVYLFCAIWSLVTIALALYFGSFLPLMLVGLPRLYGAWHHVMVGLLQHGGLAENVTDHRLNSRTVYMNPISRFIYWNMNYHVEHHMFPMVPYHALPKLHELIKHDLPKPNPSIWHAYRDVFPVVLRQLRHEEYYLKRELPPTARPYRAEFHKLNAATAAE